MASTGSSSRIDPTPLLDKIQTSNFLVRQLSTICQLNGLKSTGVKAELIRRILEYIDDCAKTNDAIRFNQVRQSILTVQSSSSTSRHSGTTSLGKQVSFTVNTTNMSQGHGYHNAASNGTYRSAPHQIVLTFKPSPFYSIVERVGSVHTCDTMISHRSTVTIPIRINDHPSLAQCKSDPTMRVMIFCSGDYHGQQDIAFPHQAELKVNGGEIKANLRGLKNKPGSTRPVDITDHLRLSLLSYLNNVDFAYALTTKASRDFQYEKYYLAIYLCKVTPVKDLVKKIEQGRRILKSSVIDEITQQAQDSDVVATAQVLSLKCPLSYMRLATPCRSVACKHIQCFDATSYLQLQEQGPQWLCPICNKPAPFESLAVDEYVKEILQQTSSSTEQVTIETDGEWRVQGSNAELPTPAAPEFHSYYARANSNDDDIISIIESSGFSSRGFGTPLPRATTNSSPAGGTPRPSGSISGKRTISEVIDLTGSSDEEDNQAPPPKRQNLTPSDAFYHSFQR